MCTSLTEHIILVAIYCYLVTMLLTAVTVVTVVTMRIYVMMVDMFILTKY